MPYRFPVHQTVKITLEILVRDDTVVGMARPSATPGAGMDARPEPVNPVLGRIDAAESDLVRAIDAWLEHLRAKGGSPRTRTVYRAEILAAARTMGWSSATDLTYDAVVQYLARRQQDRAWAPSTYNRNLACFRSFARYLDASGRAEKDPLRMAAGRRSSGERGARAATLEEARSLIEHARARQSRDLRCTGDRALYWLLLFACGLRVGEPANLRWRHVRIDHTVPHIAWEPGIQKNGRRQNVAIASEAAELLRAHRTRVPSGSDDPVFPVVPSRVTFRQDRAAIGVEAVDDRGYRFSPHAARKTFCGWLLAANVHERLIRFLMRHACDASQRYTDPSLEEQARALTAIPRLWTYPQNVDNPRPQVADLTTRREVGSVADHATPSDRTQDSPTPPGVDPLDGVALDARTSMPGGVVESVTGGAGAGGNAAASLEKTGIFSPTMPIVGQINPARTSRLGDLLVILGELLREEAGHDGRSNERAG